MSLTPPNVQFSLRHIDTIGGETVHPVATNVTEPFRIGCVPKSSGLMPSAINTFLQIFTTWLKVFLNLSYCDFPSKILQFPYKIVGLDMMYSARANIGQTTGSRGLA